MVNLIAIGIILGIAILGFFMGCGKVISFLANGILGKILTVIVFYFTFGIVLNFSFSQELMIKIATAIAEKNSSILNFLLLTIRLDLIIFAGLFFLALFFARRFLVGLIRRFLEMDIKPMVIINRTLGVLLALLWLVMITLTVFQISMWVRGLESSVYMAIAPSRWLSKLYMNNPLISIIKSINIRQHI